MIFQEAPVGFKPQFEVVGCFCDHEGKILLIQSVTGGPESGSWGLPGGKTEGQEGLAEAAVRELEEETGLAMPKTKLRYAGVVYVKKPRFDFVYHMFQATLNEEFVPKLDPKEHEAYVWISIERVGGLKLMQHVDDCVKIVYQT